MNAEAIKQFLIATVVPTIAGFLATWLASTKVLALFNITPGAAASEISSVLVFIVVTAIAFLVNHHILAGHYTPAAKAAAARRSDV